MAASLPYAAVNLSENDVPGAVFVHEDIGRHSVIQLKRWLQCRGLPVKGKKEELIERCNKFIKLGNSSINNVVDNGELLGHSVKAARSKILSNIECNRPPQFPVTGWKMFPSVSIPQNFSYHHIHEHLVTSSVNITLNGGETLRDSDDEPDIHTSKPLKKGRVYFTSGNVKNLKDRNVSNHEKFYCLKADVMSSYHMETTYSVLVMLSMQGKVVDASCHCKASAMARCNHVAAVLFALEDYVTLFGNEPVSCTSKMCGWNQGRKSKRSPTEISLANYNKKATNGRKDYEPRPEEYITSEINNDRVNRLLVNMQRTTVIENLKFPCMWEQILDIHYDDYELDAAHLSVLIAQVNIFMQNIVKAQNCPYMVKATMSQGESETWKSVRCVLVTASRCRDVYTHMLKTGNNMKPFFNLIKSILWEKSFFQTRAMAYGTKHEPIALKCYEKEKLVVVQNTGLWVNPKYPGLAASPDGLVTDSSALPPDGLVEIKCPKVLEALKPEEIENLKPTQRNSFCCKLKDGHLTLKQNHKYFYQIQMQMAITERKWCDFVVWTPKGLSSQRIQFDQEMWERFNPKLIEFHQGFLVPEYFEQRIPRKLMPFDLRKYVVGGKLVC